MTPIHVQVISDLHPELAPRPLPGAEKCRTDADLVVVQLQVMPEPRSAVSGQPGDPDPQDQT